MITNILLDSGILILHLRNQKRTTQLLRVLSRTEQLAVSVVTRTEILAGSTTQNRFETRRFLGRFSGLPVTAAIADRAGDISSTLRQNGLTVEVPNAIIAATAILHNVPLLTLNRKHFEIIPGLRLYPVPEE